MELIERDKTQEITGLAQEAKGLRINWADGQESFFHYIWLRDSCFCEDCGDSYSSKRFFVPHQVPLDIKPLSSEIDPVGDLSIVWNFEGHHSRYQPQWLRRHCYSDQARRARRHRPELWDATKIEAEQPSVPFEAARDEPEKRLEFLRLLRDYGIVLIKDGPTGSEGAQEIASLIGELEQASYDKVFDLSPQSPLKLMGNLTREVPPHTDEAFRYSPPGIVTIHCVRAASVGGESVFVDGFQVAGHLRQNEPKIFDLLTTHSLGFHRYHPGGINLRNRARTIVLDDEGEIVGFRFHTRALAPLDVPSDLVEPLYEANQALCRLMVDHDHQWRRKLLPGEAMVFDNHRVMHARAAFEGDRLLRLCNVPRETFHQNLRNLALDLGHEEEAHWRLASGA